MQVDYWLSAAAAASAALALRSDTASTTALSVAATALSTVSTALSASVSRQKDKDKEKKDGDVAAAAVKYTVKAGFRWIVVKRLPPAASFSASQSSAPVLDAATSAAKSLFTMTFGVKEKKQKSKHFQFFVFPTEFVD